MFSVMGVSTRVCKMAHNCHGNKKKHCQKEILNNKKSFGLI